MNKLLSANLARLKKSGVFWICMGFMFAMGVFIIRNQWDIVESGNTVNLETLFFGYTLLVTIPSAAFISLFLGTEYSDGTIRNKLVVGHHRSSVYLSNLVVCIMALLLMSFVYMIIMMTLGTACFGFFTSDLTVIFAYVVISIMMIIALASIFTMLSMLIQNKANVAVVSILVILILLFWAINIQIKLNSPEFYSNQFIQDSMGNVTEFNNMPNPDYISGTERIINQFLINFLPTGQALQLTNMQVIHTWLLPLYSLLITIITTFSGMLLFNKKDLK